MSWNIRAAKTEAEECIVLWGVHFTIVVAFNNKYVTQIEQEYNEIGMDINNSNKFKL